MHSLKRVDVTGLLTLGEKGYVITPEKGTLPWALEPSRKLERWIDRRVHIHGIRVGFSELSVMRITAADDLPNPVPIGVWGKLRAWWVGRRAR